MPKPSKLSIKVKEAGQNLHVDCSLKVDSGEHWDLSCSYHGFDDAHTEIFKRHWEPLAAKYDGVTVPDVDSFAPVFADLVAVGPAIHADLKALGE